MKRVLLFTFGMLLIWGCERQQPLDDYDLVFIGSWSSDDYYLEIGANGYGFCQERNRDPIEGWVDIRRDEIIFRGNGRRKDFYIDAEPFIDRGDIMMILDGEYFYLH